MAYPPLVRQDGFQSPSKPADDERDDPLFMPFIQSFRKANTSHLAHQQQIDFADELATLIETPHVPSHERSTQSSSPNDDTYRHNIFDISAPPPQQQHHIYPHDYAHFNAVIPALNSSLDQSQFQFRNSPSPTHRSRSRSRAPSLGPTRSARRDRRANSISSHVSSTSPPPRPHPHAIVIPGRGNPMGGFFVPNATSAPPDYNLPTPDSLSHSFGLQHPHAHAHSQYPYPAQTPSSPYYAYPSINRPPTPNMGISPTDVEALNSISINGITAQHLASSLPASHVASIPKPAPSSASATKQIDPDTHLSEKRRRRRESHNAVERRRRDNINERIGELAGLIPGVLFESNGPLVVPGTSATSATGPNIAEDMFTIGILGDPGMHILTAEDGLPDLPEEGSMVKKDPSEDGEAWTPMSPTSASANGSTAHGISINGNITEQSTIKANKGMILRKSVEYIRYLQQLVSVQASRGRDLEERNRVLERELAMLRGEVGPSPSASSASSLSPLVASSTILSMSSSASSKPPSVGDLDGTMQRCGDDLEMEDASVNSEAGERSREREGLDESRGRRLGRTRDKTHTHALGEQGMEI